MLDIPQDEGVHTCAGIEMVPLVLLSFIASFLVGVDEDKWWIWDFETPEVRTDKQKNPSLSSFRALIRIAVTVTVKSYSYNIPRIN